MLPFDILEIIMSFTLPHAFIQLLRSNKNLYQRSRKYLNLKIGELYSDPLTRLCKQLNYGNWKQVIYKAKRNSQVILEFVKKPEVIKELLLEIRDNSNGYHYVTHPFLEFLLLSGQKDNYNLAIKFEPFPNLFHQYLLSKGSNAIYLIEDQVKRETWRLSLHEALQSFRLNILFLSLKKGSWIICMPSAIITICQYYLLNKLSPYLFSGSPSLLNQFVTVIITTLGSIYFSLKIMPFLL